MGGFGKGTMEEEEEEIHKLHISSLEEPRGRSWSGSILLDILASWRTSRRASWQELLIIIIGRPNIVWLGKDPSGL